MRPVTVYEWKKSESGVFCEKKPLGKGIFHGWGSDYEEFKNNAGNFSTAIIEMEDGTVNNVNVEMIKFEDK